MSLLERIFTASPYGRSAALLPALLLGALPSLVAAQAHLAPAPREAHFAAPVPLPATLAITVPGHDPEDEFAASDLRDALTHAAPGSAAGSYTVKLLRTNSTAAQALLAAHKLSFDKPMQAEGYVLILENTEADIIAQSAAGVFYGIQSFKQLLPLPGEKAELATGTLRDWPAMQYRAIDDDLSRGPFPTLDFQKQQIREIAALKGNIYSPYFEHTLAYKDQPLANPNDSSMSPADVAELVRYARQYHVDILPEQEAFGHLHHVLKYDIYQDLVETPHGHVLAPGQPGTLPLIKSWFTQIAAEFPSPFMHLGADETFDLGLGRTKDAVKSKGYGPVYMDFLTAIHDELKPLNRRLLFWGDMGNEHPEAISRLPKDMIAIPWNYWDTKGFDHLIEPFAKAGIETWVAPGDANWNEVYPLVQHGMENIGGFVADGQRLGSTGAITTIWNDDGEGLFNLDWEPALFGAVAPWQAGPSSIDAYKKAFGPLFYGDTTGKINQAVEEITASENALGEAKTSLNSDQLFWLDPWTAMGQEVHAKILPHAKELRSHAERAIILIAQAREANPNLRHQDALDGMELGARRLDLIGMKAELSAEMVEGYALAVKQQHDKDHRSATENYLFEVSSMNGRCQDLRDSYTALKDLYRKVWLSENRPYWLGNVLVRYDLAAQLWQDRGQQITWAIIGFENGKDLPAFSTFGYVSK